MLITESDSQRKEIKGLVLDHVLGITFDSADITAVDGETFAQNVWGLYTLADNVRRAEHSYAEQVNHAIYQFHENFRPDLPAMFNWFASTFHNHLRLIALCQLINDNGWTADDLMVKANAEKTSKHCRDYAEAVDPDLFRWRMKVAAHNAATDPRLNSDTAKLLRQSVSTKLDWMYPFFRVGSMRPIGLGAGEALPIWALTQKYDFHTKRFWPTSGIMPSPRPPKQPQPPTSHLHTFGQKR